MAQDFKFEVGDRVRVKAAPGILGQLAPAYPESLFELTGEIGDQESQEAFGTNVYYVILDEEVPESAEGNTWYFDEDYLERV